MSDTVMIDGEASLEYCFDGEASLEYCLDGEWGQVIKVTEHDLPVYTGATNVVPDFSRHVLATANKTVLSDITVEATPVNSAVNAAGGYTVWIGGI